MARTGTTTHDGAGGRTALLGFLWLGWVLLPPVLLAWSELSTWTLYGEPVPPEEERRAFLWALAALALAVGLPLLGLCLTVGTGSRGSPVAFGVALALGIAVAGLVLHTHQAQQPGPADPVDRGGGACQEHSGGDNRCPGG